MRIIKLAFINTITEGKPITYNKQATNWTKSLLECRHKQWKTVVKTWQLKVEISLWSAHLFSMLWCINCLCCICFHQINLLSMEHNFDIVSIWISRHTLSHLATCTLYVFKCWVSLLRQCLLYICWLSEIFADESWLSSINLPDGSSPKINSCSSGSSACVYREGMTSGAMNG